MMCQLPNNYVHANDELGGEPWHPTHVKQNVTRTSQPQTLCKLYKSINISNYNNSQDDTHTQSDKLWHKNETKKDYFDSIFSFQESLLSSQTN